jgi:hypothetical protein
VAKLESGEFGLWQGELKATEAVRDNAHVAFHRPDLHAGERSHCLLVADDAAYADPRVSAHRNLGDLLRQPSQLHAKQSIAAENLETCRIRHEPQHSRD